VQEGGGAGISPEPQPGVGGAADLGGRLITPGLCIPARRHERLQRVQDLGMCSEAKKVKDVSKNG